MLIQDRITMIMKANNLSPSQFADMIGVQRSNISHVLNGRNKPSLDFLSKIITKFPKVNASWLITGEVREENAVEALEGKQDRSAVTLTGKTTSVARKIERIVIFYNDGSFHEYLRDH